MKANQLIESLASRAPGSIAWILYSGIPSGLNAAAKRENRIQKESSIPIQLASYENRAAVKAAIAAGEREAPQLPAWLEFVEPVRSGSYIARHKTEGTLYFRAPKVNVPAKPARYFMDGEEIEFEKIKSFFTASALAPKKTKEDLNAIGQDEFRGVKLENITAIH